MILDQEIAKQKAALTVGTMQATSQIKGQQLRQQAAATEHSANLNRQQTEHSHKIGMEAVDRKHEVGLEMLDHKAKAAKQAAAQKAKQPAAKPAAKKK
jgi:hypothetical protein